MARPKKGERGYAESNSKWRKTMLKKYGDDEEALSNFFRKIGSIGGKRSRTGGFASNKVGEDGMTGHERARVVGSLGGKKSRRGPAKARENGRD